MLWFSIHLISWSHTDLEEEVRGENVSGKYLRVDGIYNFRQHFNSLSCNLLRLFIGYKSFNH